MIIIGRRFPDFSAPGYNIDNPCPEEGWPNAALLASATRHHYPEHTVPLTLSMSLGGESVFEVGKTVYRTGDSHYLLLNEGQRVARTIDAPTPVEAYSVVFRSAFVQDMLRGMTTNEDVLLSDPRGGRPITIHFHETLYRTGDRVSQSLQELRNLILAGVQDQMPLEEQFHKLLCSMLGVHRGVIQQVLRLPPVKQSTKLELYRRIYRARDYLHAHYDEPLSLDDIAQVACLSRFHFLRTFKQVFRMTPHQYLMQLRCLKAYELLLADETLTVREVTRRLGLKSVGSFTRLLTRQFGVSPKRLINGRFERNGKSDD